MAKELLKLRQGEHYDSSRVRYPNGKVVEGGELREYLFQHTGDSFPLEAGTLVYLTFQEFEALKNLGVKVD